MFIAGHINQKPRLSVVRQLMIWRLHKTHERLEYSVDTN